MSCVRPYFRDDVRDFNGDKIPIPCGSCFSCRLDIQRMAIDRMFTAWHSHDCSAYVTFTYDDNHLVFQNGFEQPTLSKDDVHKYLDNIKHQLRHIDFEYYVCGEYGDKFNRPHYHALFFGLDYQLHEKFFKSSWKKGSVMVMPVNSGSFRYVAKYLTVPVSRDYLDAHYYDFGLEVPFRKMSRGLGLKVYRQFLDDLNTYGYFEYFGRKIYLNRYYFNKLLLHSDKLVVVAENRKYKSNRKKSDEAFHNNQHLSEFVNNNAEIKENHLISKALRSTSKLY